jgi:uncharacterized membrane protein YcfT
MLDNLSIASTLPVKPGKSIMQARLTERMVWVDIAKAISILLVVYHHAIYAWSEFAGQLDATFTFFRMPIFFFASGMFIKKMMELNFPAFVARRLAPLLYLFLVWSIIKWALIDLFRYLFIRGDLDLSSLLLIFITPPQTLWFIYALAIFSAVAWSARKLSRHAVTTAAVFCTLVQYVGATDGSLFLVKLTKFFVWFWLGYVLSDAAQIWSQRRVHPMLLLLIPIWLVASFFILNRSTPSLFWALPLTITALPVGFLLAVSLSRTKLGNPLAWIGKNTLPIYVSHFIALSLMGKAFERLQLPTGVLPTIITAAIAVIFALVGRAIAVRVGFGWLYDLPTSWRSRLEHTMALASKRSQPRNSSSVPMP